jgi:transcriptional regulator with XRE-family HTH domain
MANRLKMAQIQAVTALLQQGWSQRRIARELGLDRETVARYAKRSQERVLPVRMQKLVRLARTRRE